MSRTEFTASKSLRLALEGNALEVTQTAPRYMRASGLVRECSLDLSTSRSFLHIFGSSLYVGIALTAKEVGAIRERLGPLGLRINSPSPAAPSSAAGHEATDATDLPVSGEGGTTSPPVCTGGDALESEASILAYALTHGECY